jgi:hypothetical protein
MDFYQKTVGTVAAFLEGFVRTPGFSAGWQPYFTSI